MEMWVELKKKLDQIILVGPANQKPWIEDLLQTLPQFEKDQREELQILPATEIGRAHV